MQKNYFKFIVILILTVAFLTGKSQESKNSLGRNQINKSELDTVILAKPVKITKSDFLNEIWDYNNSPKEWKYKGAKPAIIDFYADWCGPCRIAAPILDEVQEEFSGKIQVYKIDTQEERELASVFGINSIPAFLYIPLIGRPTMVSGIGRTKEETKQMFTDHIKQYLTLD